MISAISVYALAASVVLAFAVSEVRWRRGLTPIGRVAVPVILGVVAWLSWLGFTLATGQPA